MKIKEAKTQVWALEMKRDEKEVKSPLEVCNHSSIAGCFKHGALRGICHGSKIKTHTWQDMSGLASRKIHSQEHVG